MAYRITQTDEKGLWQVKYTGKVDVRTRQVALEEVIRLAEEKEITGVLVDLSEAGLTNSPMEEFDFGVAIASSPRSGRIKFAFLHKPTDMHKSEFLETVITNRGRRAKIFSDRDAAIEFLAER